MALQPADEKVQSRDAGEQPGGKGVMQPHMEELGEE